MNMCGTNINSVASPLMAKACKLHSCIFGMIYEYPFQIRIEKSQIVWKFENIFQANHKFYFLSLLCLTITLCACILLITLNSFMANTSRATFVAIVYCVYLGSCACFELCTIFTFSKSTEVVSILNQLLFIERKCKFLVKF